MGKVDDSLLSELRWAWRMIRARRLRHKMLFSERVKFDDEMRPIVVHETIARIAYPDAFYHVEADDLERAIRKGSD